MTTLVPQFGFVMDSLTEEQHRRMVDEWKKGAVPAICPACGGGTKRPIHRWHYRGCLKQAGQALEYHEQVDELCGARNPEDGNPCMLPKEHGGKQSAHRWSK